MRVEVGDYAIAVLSSGRRRGSYKVSRGRVNKCFKPCGAQEAQGLEKESDNWKNGLFLGSNQTKRE